MEELTDKLTETIAGCEFCEGEERAQMAHVFESDLHSDESFGYTSGEPLGMFLADKGVPDQFISLFVAYVECSQCGSGRNADQRDDPIIHVLDKNFEVYSNRDVANFWGHDMYYDEMQFEQFCNFTNMYNVQLNHSQLSEFGEFLLNILQWEPNIL